MENVCLASLAMPGCIVMQRALHTPVMLKKRGLKQA